jgi:hypothetical protein
MAKIKPWIKWVVIAAAFWFQQLEIQYVHEDLQEVKEFLMQVSDPAKLSPKDVAKIQQLQTVYRSQKPYNL